MYLWLIVRYMLLRLLWAKCLIFLWSMQLIEPFINLR